MYYFTKSTPDRWCKRVPPRTHKALAMAYAKPFDGCSVYWQGFKGKPRYIGYFSGGKLIKP